MKPAVALKAQIRDLLGFVADRFTARDRVAMAIIAMAALFAVYILSAPSCSSMARAASASLDVVNAIGPVLGLILAGLFFSHKLEASNMLTREV